MLPLSRLAVRASRVRPALRCTCHYRTTAIARYPRWINSKDDKPVEEEDEHEDDADKPATSTASTSAPAPSSSPSNASSSDGGPPKPPKPTSITKVVVPDVYPQVLALPITRRPLFPGFYKAVVIRQPAVVAAIKEMMKRGQPYLGAFLLKDPDADADLITDLDSVHHVGVFAQITSVFSNNEANKKDGEAESLTAVLYPHRRIRIDELIPPPAAAKEDVGKIVTEARQEGLVPPAPKQEDSPPPYSEPGSPHSAPGSVPFQTAFLQDYAVSLANVTNLVLPSPPSPKGNSQVVRAITSEIISVFKDIAALNPLFRDQIANFSLQASAGQIFEEPDKLADFAAAVSTGELNELQDVLESLNLEDRLQKSLLVLKKELINAQLQAKISKDVESKIQKRQREFYLMEQLKGIKKELGLESDGKDKLIEKFKEKAAQLNMPAEVGKVFEEELSKLQTLEPAASEFNVTRNYLDWITQIPWGRHSQENFSIPHATKVLDEDHYGLKDVKDRILEFLAVGKLRGTVEGKILCFVGPPGVGKTSIGKSIARALNRQFYRFSVGGLTDVAEIKGHRRTYVGAMPGKPIQALKKVQTENPLILIDEVDKIGRGHNGDPSSALLEMLDPEQNSGFLDHYLDVPVDLSRVLFVCTANVLDTIPAPLLDRMEVMEVSGYVSDEKRAIASRYLGPQAKESTGLKSADVELTTDAIDSLIRYYCRESGVRKLKQHIEKLYRKAAFKIVSDLGDAKLEEPVKATPTKDTKKVKSEKPSKATSTKSPAAKEETKEEQTTTTEPRKPLDVPSDVHVRITADTLVDYLGPAVYPKERIYTQTTPPGVSTGLGYLGNGSGSVMPIEATVMPGSSNTLQLTGKLGEVIRESAQIALSFIKTNAYVLGLTDDRTKELLKDKTVHLHMPEGGVGKDGPSAGTALLTALMSLFTNQGVSSNLAMTGEMTLAGQVLPVGGLKEKILAAHRAGIKKLIVPEANRNDISFNVPESVKEGITIVYVQDVRQVLTEVFSENPNLLKRLDSLPLVPLEEVQNTATAQQGEQVKV